MENKSRRMVSPWKRAQPGTYLSEGKDGDGPAAADRQTRFSWSWTPEQEVCIWQEPEGTRLRNDGGAAHKNKSYCRKTQHLKPEKLEEPEFSSTFKNKVQLHFSFLNLSWTVYENNL